MVSVEYAQAMAHYNREMNARLYASCAALTDEQRKRDVGAFFKSLHGTLNHLLLGDRVWMGRFTGAPIAIQSLDQELYSGFDELSAQRRQTDADIVDWVNTLTAAGLEGDVSNTIRNGAMQRSLPLWFAVTHFFNHETHHRGQITTLLSQLGIDPGVTDLIAFPRNA